MPLLFLCRLRQGKLLQKLLTTLDHKPQLLIGYILDAVIIFNGFSR